MSEFYGEPEPLLQPGPRCTSHHYVTGWLSQQEAGHEGPHIAEAGIMGGYYRWTHNVNEPACNQKPFTPSPRTAIREALS